MKRLSKNDIRMEDYKHVEMLDDYKQLVDNGHKKEYVIAVWLESLGASKRDIRKSKSIVLGENMGLTFSSEDLRMSLVCVSNATSEEEWWDTVVHEIDHLQHSICRYYDIEHGSEDCAYLQGELMRLVVSGLKKMR